MHVAQGLGIALGLPCTNTHSFFLCKQTKSEIVMICDRGALVSKHQLEKAEVCSNLRKKLLI